MGFFVCNPLILYMWIDMICYTLCYDRLLITNRTVVESSSIYKTKTYSGSADKTIDREFSQTYANCMHTNTEQSEAWLKIDLGDIFNLRSVKIWYRNDRGSISTRRLQGFSILASKNSDLDKNDTCYRDFGNLTLDTMLEVSCSRTAQFIKIYKKGNGAILEICEVEIFGCPRKKYGEKCVSCDMCKQDCDIMGRCDGLGCLHNSYTPPFCKECQEGFYGGNCIPCGHCAKNATCHHVTGYCPNGHCKPGWKFMNKRCSQECDDGTFGYYCRNNCSGNCAGRFSCNKVDGICPSGCADGWMNDNCNKTCSNGRYGKKCKEKCGHCERDKSCHHINGSCPGLCEPGYHGEKCLMECSPGSYGKNCTDKCGHCERNESCDHINGSCPALCEPGYHGEKCRTACSAGRYGKECKKECGHCESNDPCHHVNGSCPGLCEPGYHGEKCLTECSSGRYGKDCKEKCGNCERNETCNHINGSCPGLCEPGYHGEKCNTACSPGRYGKNCKDNCGHCERNAPCDHINGFCRASLCKPGYHGKKCLTKQLVIPGYTKAKSSSVAYMYGGYPNKTVDGDPRQSHYLYCMHTAGKELEAWLMIDLIKIYNIHSVKFWYRNDAPGHNTRRIQGFNIRLSNTTRTNHQDICYQDAGNKTLPPIIEKECKGAAQYVWIYTNKTHEDGVFLEICEVKIFGCSYQDSDGNCISCNQCKNDCNINGECDDQGCKKDGYRPPYCKECRSGKYGKDCNSSCGHCANNGVCNNVTGSCPGESCAPGWKHTVDWKCNQACKEGTFGNNCTSKCSDHCAKGSFCNKIDGQCPSGCEDGWERLNCSKPCSHGRFGKNCGNECGHCASNDTCHHVNGICPGLCEPGYKRKRCKNECIPGLYGQNCSLSCGQCAKPATCDHVNGSCPSGHCEPGWKDTPGKRCDQGCDAKTYGLYCKHNCSGHCAGGLPCNKADGVCLRGCADGWKNPRCNEKCDEGFYGRNCRLTCGNCAKNATCDHVDGSCPSGYCEPGWKHTIYKRCDQECDDGTYGLYCDHSCSVHCAGELSCNKANGVCLGGCADGWIKPNCDEKCKEGLYGRNCTFSCGFCAKNSTCDHVNGSCPSGQCEPGWKYTSKERCDQECDNGTFGYHCMYICSGHCAGGLPCKKSDGICLEGCADGWTNNKCNETCGVGFYGRRCQEHCGHCGGPATCHHINGSCPGLCEPGYQGEKCNIECENGTFGLRCNFTCGEGCLSVCNKKNGTCDFCQYGYIGEFCNITVAEAQEQEVAVAAVGVGFGFMVIVLIAIIVLVVVLARKAKRRKAAGIELPERNGVPNNELLENKPQDNANKTVEDGHVEENPEVEDTVIDNGEMKTLIKIADLGKKIKLFSMEENKKFTAEFKGIPYGEQPHIPCSVAKQQDNMPKNRYKTTFPYDHSRVVLHVCPENDYINGNYIKDMEGKRRYIATQGPRKNTVQDFWAMIWQENIRVIVMVTNLTEGSTIKCEQYWPGQGAQMTSGPYCLQLMSQKDYAKYIQRDINITDKKTKVVRTVNQVQFTAWPDHGTPSPVELLVFYRHVMRLRQMYPDSLMVVHCSAGIGRTGTFIALDALYKQGLKEGKIDVVEYVKIMREDRMNMIQNAGQYVFLYKALYEIFKMNGRLLKKEQFIQEVTSQLMSDKAANASYFKKEFNELLAIRPVLEEQDTKDARQKIDLNMTKTVLPADNVRSFLTSYVRGRGNYYNAVSMSSYTLRDGLIAAQYPVQGAAIDLVRLLIDHEITILVSINQLTDIASSAEWFTTSAEKSVVSPYKTMLGASRSISPNLKMTVLKLKHDKDSEWHTVKVLEILNWRVNEKLPAEEEVLVELMNKVQEIVKDPETKITVLSRDGATGCGIFCAVYNAIQQLQQDNEVDMFTIVRQLQMRRPEMISSMNEYQCCCQVVANFFDAHKDDIYANAQGQPEVTKAEENVYANT